MENDQNVDLTMLEDDDTKVADDESTEGGNDSETQEEGQEEVDSDSQSDDAADEDSQEGQEESDNSEAEAQKELESAVKQRQRELNKEIDEMKTRDSVATMEREISGLNRISTPEEISSRQDISYEEALKIHAQTKMEAEQANKEAVDNHLRHVEDIKRAYRDFPVFDTHSKQYDPEMGRIYDRAYKELGSVSYHQGSQYISSANSPYELALTLDEIYQKGLKDGQTRLAKADIKTEKKVSSSNTSGKEAKGVKEDPTRGMSQTEKENYDFLNTLVKAVEKS